MGHDFRADNKSVSESKKNSVHAMLFIFENNDDFIFIIITKD